MTRPLTRLGSPKVLARTPQRAAIVGQPFQADSFCMCSINVFLSAWRRLKTAVRFQGVGAVCVQDVTISGADHRPIHRRVPVAAREKGKVLGGFRRGFRTAGFTRARRVRRIGLCQQAANSRMTRKSEVMVSDLVSSRLRKEVPGYVSKGLTQRRKPQRGADCSHGSSPDLSRISSFASLRLCAFA
jgi:hypothetical protein